MLFIKDILDKKSFVFEDLVSIMKILRTKEIGCPWDIEQTHKSIRNNFIEEVYEAVEAIDTENDELLKEELGDVLMQVVFHAEISESENSFNIDDVCDGVCKKLILRHPHVFGDIKVSDSSDVLTNWDKIKQVEKKQKTFGKVLDDIARTLPSLTRAQKIRKKIVKAGEDKDCDVSDAILLLNGLADKLEKGGYVTEDDIGEILFAVTDISRCADIDAEQALYNKCNKTVKAYN